MNIEIWGTETNRRHFFIGTVIFGDKEFRFKVIFGPGLLEQTKGRPDIHDKEIQRRILVDIFDPRTFDPNSDENVEIEIDSFEEVFLIELIAGFLLDQYYNRLEEALRIESAEESKGETLNSGVELRDKFRRDDGEVPQLIKRYQAA